MATITYDERLDTLLGAAARTFAARGYHSTSMRDLSRETGMSLAGIYYYVPGKDELLFRIQERTFREVVDGAAVAVAAGTDPVDRLRRFIQHHVTYFAAHMAEMKVLSHDAESLSEERRREVDALKRRHTEMLVQILEDLDREGQARIPERVAAYALFGMMNWIYTWYDPDGSVTPAALADQIAELFLRGVTPAAAHPEPK